MSPAPPVSLRFRLPAPALRPLVSSYYLVEHGDPAAPPLVDLLHPEWANLRFVLSGKWRTETAGSVADSTLDPALAATVYGPTSRCVRFTGQGGTMLGIGLLPLGWARLVDARAADFADRVRPLADVWGEAAGELLGRLRTAADDDARVALLDAELLARLAASPEPAPTVVRAHALLVSGGLGTVGEMADALELSPRQLERVSLQCFGFGPKLLLRRQRFLRTLAAMTERLDTRWVELLDPLYCDQSHFVRDCQRFLGMSPTAYFALPRHVLEKAVRARRALIGQAMQGLQPPAAMAETSKAKAPALA